MTSTQWRGLVRRMSALNSPSVRIGSYKMVNNNQKNTIPGNSFPVITLVFFNVAITFDPAQKSTANELPAKPPSRPVAGSTNIFICWSNSMSWSSKRKVFFIAILRDNIIGGASLVAALGPRRKPEGRVVHVSTLVLFKASSREWRTFLAGCGRK